MYISDTSQRALSGPRRRTQVAVDATGLSPGALRTFFVRRMYHHDQQPMSWRHSLKGLLVVDLYRQLVLAQQAHAGPTHDGTNLRALVDMPTPSAPSAGCWPTPSSTANSIIPTFASDAGPTA